MPTTITGIQQKKSVKMMKATRLARADSRLTFVDLIELDDLTADKNIAKYASDMNRKASKFNPMNMLTEYSQPGGLSSESCRARHTAERP